MGGNTLASRPPYGFVYTHGSLQIHFSMSCPYKAIIVLISITDTTLGSGFNRERFRQSFSASNFAGRGRSRHYYLQLVERRNCEHSISVVGQVCHDIFLAE